MLSWDEIETIKAEAQYCASAQSWCPTAVRTAWAPFVSAVVEAAEDVKRAEKALDAAWAEGEALGEAFPEVALAEEDLAEAEEVLAEAVKAARAEADRLARVRAEALLEEIVDVADLLGMGDAAYAGDGRQGADVDLATGEVVFWAAARYLVPSEEPRIAEVRRQLAPETITAIKAGNGDASVRWA